MGLKEQITDDMKTAMRARESERLGTIRLLLAACKQKEVDERITLDDAAVVGIIDKMIKQRKDSIEAFTSAQRRGVHLGTAPGSGRQGERRTGGAGGLPAPAHGRGAGAQRH